MTCPLDPGRAPYRIASDLTIEGLRRSFDEGIASQGVFSTEAGAVLAGHAMTQENRTKTAANLCGLGDRGHISVVRGGGGRTERYGVRLSVHLLIQAAARGDVLADETLSGVGFWPRLLLAWPAPLEPRKYRPWQPDQSQAIRAYWQRCERLLALPMPEECDNLAAITLHADALKRMANFFERMEHEARKGDLSDVRAFALRGTELACRIAGVLAAFDGKSHVDSATASNGTRLAEHSLRNWLDALGGKSDPVPGWAFTLYRWLAELRGLVAVRDIPRIGPASVRPANRRDRAILSLADHASLPLQPDEQDGAADTAAADALDTLALADGARGRAAYAPGPGHARRRRWRGHASRAASGMGSPAPLLGRGTLQRARAAAGAATRAGLPTAARGH